MYGEQTKYDSSEFCGFALMAVDFDALDSTEIIGGISDCLKNSRI